MPTAIALSTTNTPVSAFSFEGADIRVISFDGEPAFIGKDVCERLGYADASNAMKLHCKGMAKYHPLPTSGGTQQLRILSEADVLRLIVRSKLPEAERFERWVFEEVLPAIRKTGGYMVAAPEETPDQLVLRAMTVLQATVERQKEQLADALPKVAAYARLAEADGRNPIHRFRCLSHARNPGRQFQELQ